MLVIVNVVDRSDHLYLAHCHRWPRTSTTRTSVHYRTVCSHLYGALHRPRRQSPAGIPIRIRTLLIWLVAMKKSTYIGRQFRGTGMHGKGLRHRLGIGTLVFRPHRRQAISTRGRNKCTKRKWTKLKKLLRGQTGNIGESKGQNGCSLKL